MTEVHSSGNKVFDQILSHNNFLLFYWIQAITRTVYGFATYQAVCSTRITGVPLA